ncbi:CPBP family intramembrane metalloprotease [Phormidium sp. CLA17]|uniref:CPBP family intramembrane glutamic endopeptidase n=1 Tax=Leptolyngbya sp. Cla-17 TaxID=2803751 RepID=UPI00149293AD|nr:type II CAAX endopeptidase family protein [Leptolyngbya sp. Cla-17]MBM0743029.1 CPBP family intramembrane metalloprotease [Leptolyngbya sp. Cla-17]
MKVFLSQISRYPAPARVAIFVGVLLLLWAPFAIAGYWLVADKNLASILSITVLYLEFIGLVRIWGKQIHREPRVFWQYGLEFTPRIGLELITGLGIGFFSLLLLFGVETLFGFVEWQSPTAIFPKILLEGLLVSVAIAFAEELLFRGWLFDELQRDYTPLGCLWINAIAFAVIHFNLLAFPSLLCLGIALVWTKRASYEPSGKDYRGFKRLRGRLGLPMGLHAGLVFGNYLLEVGKLIQYTDRVPVWVTGINRNPLVGLMGFLFLVGLAIAMRHYAQRRLAGSKW